ncbi:FliM/FliN family flagellar motor switch protein [Arcobacter porcinus]|uniref:Flagellar motor switch protein FliN n=1 Tax=Arcobacter porcinus TaxID=1935204 RepID=A0ABX2YF08_9BACT|nr:FliM/FliN family flagellar motor switch protein [Arcobacter porcinus]OCL82938.1 Flagellar motor switch protein FliN [Arcobacter porcinus]OCL84433.1 Flagellar motor switch protein FliN [Arcobacter porcinus]OCL88974.1 Flagellar motor switch protein FliN [Arcobacter porcinus]OCL93584.1 Flagellar motor switch protein FliN [Arcobacter porcinus]
MVSDLSQLFKNELANTLEQLLGKKSQVKEIKKLENSFESEKFIECDVKIEFKDIKSSFIFFIPTKSAVNFEYLMLGGMGDIKEDIDDETTDAINEIISNICGAFSTSVNAQGLADVSGVKTEVKSVNIIDKSKLKTGDIFRFDILLDSEVNPVVLYFDKVITPFFSSITGYKEAIKATTNEVALPLQTSNKSIVGVANPSKNLELLYHVKLKLSVRLGSKIVLLKDILRWDVGEIIELEQMVNEPLEILINGVKIGEGEAVIVEGKFGIKIRRIINEDLQLDKIGL